MEKNKEIPNGWIQTPFETISEVKNGFAFKSSSYTESGVPLIRISNIQDQTISLENNCVFLSIDNLEKYPEFKITNGDILVALSGATTGKYGMFNNYFQALLNQRVGLIRTRNKKEISQKYLYYFFGTIQKTIFKEAYGMAQPNISTNFLKELIIPIPPLNEQKRIVSKIEELFSLIDNVFQLLDKIKLQLVIFEKSLYHSAFIGTLSQNWRSEIQLFNSEKSLITILDDRKRKWEENQLKKFKQIGKIPKNNNWMNKYREPIKPDLNSPHIPDSWNWITLDQITWLIRDGPHYSPKYSEFGIPFITGGNIRPDGIDFENCKKISPKLHCELIKRCKPEKNDILYTKGGTTGIARTNTYDHEFSVWVHVAVLKLVDSIRPFFVQHALNSPYCYSQSQKFTHGVGNQDLGLTRMIKINLTLPPIEEQDYIIKNLEKNLSEIYHLKSNIRKFIQYVDNLKSVILKQAFEGKLIPQDPNDEPASELLKRIKLQN